MESNDPTISETGSCHKEFEVVRLLIDPRTLLYLRLSPPNPIPVSRT